MKDQKEWGLCKDCKWWQIEPKATKTGTTAGLCIDEEIIHLNLRITGNGGCNRFMSGQPVHAIGSGSAPPTAAPAR